MQAAPPVAQDVLDFAVEILREAGELTHSLWRSEELAVEHKHDGTVVTEADRAAERLLRERIAARCPGDAILGEEEGHSSGTTGRRWVIDPIDGTETFAHGVALYSNLLYLEDEHGPAVGVINVPVIGELVAAGRGRGSWYNGRRCHVNDHSTLERACVTASGYDWWDPAMLGRLRSSGVHMRTWGDGYGYVLVATGRVEAMVDPVANFWDVAPCQVVIEEAGGRWSDLGGAADAHSGSFLASNGHLHDEVLGVLCGDR